MKIILSNAEYRLLKKGILSVNDPQVINEYNKIVRHMIKTPDGVVINVDENYSISALTAIIKNSSTLSSLLKNGKSITAVPKWVTLAKAIRSDFCKSV